MPPACVAIYKDRLLDAAKGVVALSFDTIKSRVARTCGSLLQRALEQSVYVHIRRQHDHIHGLPNGCWPEDCSKWQESVPKGVFQVSGVPAVSATDCFAGERWKLQRQFRGSCLIVHCRRSRIEEFLARLTQGCSFRSPIT